MYEQSGVKNYLLNSRYVRQKSREHERGMMTARSAINQRHDKSAKLVEQLNKPIGIDKKIANANPNKLRESVFDKKSHSHVRSKTTEGMKDYGNNDTQSLKKSRVLKLGGGKYYFPKRQRFNEDLQSEVESIKSNTNMERSSRQLSKLIEANKGQDHKRATT